MRKAGVAFLLVAAACGNNENVFYGSIPSTPITPFIAFDQTQSVISGRATLTDTSGQSTGTAEVVIISDRPRLCTLLTQTRDYFRNPPEAYVAMILFIPPDNRVGTFIPGRVGDEGTMGKIIGFDPAKKDQTVTVTGGPVAQIVAADGYGYIGLSDWTENAGGESTGSFFLGYILPPQLGRNPLFPFQGKFKTTVCPTLEGTLLP
jgi:hypothetical protein